MRSNNSNQRYLSPNYLHHSSTAEMIPEEYLSDEKENTLSENEVYGSQSMAASQENEMKRRLFENLKKAGILDGMKSTLRGRLYEQLRVKKGGNNNVSPYQGKNKMTYKVATSLVADLMQRCDMPYALSVFLPESGSSQEVLSKAELIEVLNLNKDDHFPHSNLTAPSPLLLDLVDVLLSNKSIRSSMVSSFVQTEEAGDAFLTLEEKMRKIEL